MHIEEIYEKIKEIENTGKIKEKYKSFKKYVNLLSSALLKDASYWEKVKIDMEKHEYLCHASPMFRVCWVQNTNFRKNVRSLVLEFMPNESRICEIDWYGVLFIGIVTEKNRELRINFCNAMIKKLNENL